MISRVADHCFWLGRYLERAESTSRVLFVTRNLSLDAELTPRQCWQPVLIVSGEHARYEERFGPDGAADGERVQRYMTWEKDNPSSIARSVAAARENARSIREVVSLEMWETVNELHLWLSSEATQAEYQSNRYGFFRRVRQLSQLAVGLLHSTMLHDTPLDFIWLGVLLERAGQTARILDVHHHAMSTLNPHRVVVTALWLSLLRACSGFEAFMKRHQGRVTRDGVASFLILEPSFPRSVRHCIQAASETFGKIRPPKERNLPGGQAQQRLRVLHNWIEEKTPASLEPTGLHDLLTHVVDETSAICADVGRELLGG